MRVPPVPFLVRAALVTPLLAIAGVCLAIVAWVTPEVAAGDKPGTDL